VVIQRALRHSGPLDDVLDRGGGIALLGEPLAGDGDEVLAGCFRLAFPKPLDTHERRLQADHWSVTDRRSVNPKGAAP
jgi:hypothetical protein